MAGNFFKKIGELLSRVGSAPPERGPVPAEPSEPSNPPDPPSGTPAEQALEKYVRSGDFASLAKSLGPMPYKERRSLNPFFKKQVAKYRDRWTKTKSRNTALLGLLATSTPSEVKKRKSFAELGAMRALGFKATGTPIGRVTVGLIRDIKPDWVEHIADHALSSADWVHWDFAFELCSHGLCERPTHPNFALLLPRELPGMQWIGGKRRSRWDPVQLVSDHRDILVPEIERMFTLPEADKAISTWDLGQPDAAENPDAPVPYADLLLSLVEKDLLGKERLTRCCLGALSITESKQLAKWYYTLFERLNPGEAEQATYATDGDVAILTLLGNANTAVHTWALRRLIAFEKADLVEGVGIVHEIPSVIPNANKTGAAAALRLLQAIGKKHPSLRGEVMNGTCEAFIIEDKPIQERAIKILEAFKDDAPEGFTDTLAGFADSVSPTLRDRFAALGGSDDAAALIDFESEIKIEFQSPPANPLDNETRIEPIRDLDELVEQTAHFWQNTDDPLQIERIIDGMTAMAGNYPPDFNERTAPLAQLMKSDARGDGFVVLVSLQSVIRRWLNRSAFSLADLGIHSAKADFVKPTKIPQPFKWFTEDPLFSNYLAAASYWLGQKTAHPFLSLPTHTGGWIEPGALVERTIDHGKSRRPLTEPEACTALLRLAPHGREQSLEQLRAAKLKGPFPLFLRYALGDDSIIDELPDNPVLRLAAGRARYPDGGLPEILTRTKGPYAATPANLHVSCIAPAVRHTTPSWLPKGKTLEVKIPGHILTEVSPSYDGDNRRHLPPALYDRPKAKWYDAGQDPCAVRWRASIWPSNPEPALTRGIAVLAPRLDNGRSNYAQDIARAYLETLHGQRHGQAGYVLSWAGLNHSGASVRSAAVDALAINLDYDWFDPGCWAAALEPILASRVAMLNRIVPGLAELAQISPTHSLRITESLCAGLGLGTADPPRLFGKLLEFLIDQRARHPSISLSESSRRYLESLPQKGKVGKLAREIVAQPGG